MSSGNALLVYFLCVSVESIIILGGREARPQQNSANFYSNICYFSAFQNHP